MNPREWDCYQCGSRFATDANGELVEYTSTVHWCRGCQILLGILQESALWRQRARLLDPEPEMVLSVSAIAARLRQGRMVKMHDWGKAAANDRDDDEE